MGTCERRFWRAFFIKSSFFLRNLRITRIVSHLYATKELGQPRQRKREYQEIIGNNLNVQHTFSQISLS